MWVRADVREASQLAGVRREWKWRHFRKKEGRAMIKIIRALRCEKVPEKEFDQVKEAFLSWGWREMTRRDGFVYIVHEPERKPSSK